jgi:hypothetical protein
MEVFDRSLTNIPIELHTNYISNFQITYIPVPDQFVWSGLRYSTLLYATLLYATLRYSTLLYATIRYSTLLYAALRYNTIR